MKLFELLEYGPIVAHNEDLGLLITANGSYFNLWCGDGTDFENTECFHLGSRVDSDNGLYGVDMVKVMEQAEQILKDIINQEQEQ